MGSGSGLSSKFFMKFHVKWKQSVYFFLSNLITGERGNRKTVYMLVPSKRKCLLIGVILEATGKIFLAEKNIGQGGVFFLLHVKLYFVLLLDDFILLRLKARQGRGGKGAYSGD